MKNTKNNIKQFLHDARAVSPAIATLILIVVAAVAAAGIGILVSHSQGSSKEMLDSKTSSVQGKINIVGSTTVLPAILKASPEFMSENPSYSVSAVGGGSGLGRYTAWTTTSPITDVGASSEAWKDNDVQQGITLPNRADAVIQLGGKDAKVWETKIGTSMVVFAYNGKAAASATPLDVITAASSTTAISAGDILTLYTAGTSAGLTGAGKPFASATGVTVYYRSDKSGTQDTYMKYLGNPTVYDTSNSVYTPPTGPTVTATFVGLPSNEAIQAAMAGSSCTAAAVCVGFMDVGFTDGKTIVAATQGGIAAKDSTKGIGVGYDAAAKGVSPAVAPASQAGLARDLYLYSQGTPTGAIKAFIDFMLSSKGQDAVHAAGYFSS
jgi:phosphate transport system substrate-binding protein